MTIAKLYRKFAIAALLISLPGCTTDTPASQTSLPPGVPANYKLVYASDFSKPDAMDEFRYPAPKAWRISNDKAGPTLELFGEGNYRNKIRSPFNFALLKDKV